MGNLSSEDQEDQPSPEWATKVDRLAIDKLLKEGYVDCYRKCHPDMQADPGYTFSTTSPWLRFDYIFASKDLAGRLRSCEVLDKREVRAASDHFPVVAEFE